MKVTDRITLLLSCQRALLGAITENIRGITAALDGDVIRLRFIHEGDLSEEGRDRLEVVATEVVADFNDRDIEVSYMRADPPAKVEPYKLDDWVYKRYEN